MSEKYPLVRLLLPDVLEHVLYLEPGTRVAPVTEVEIEGSFFEVIGVAPYPRTPIFTGAVFHTECRLGGWRHDTR